MVPVQIKNSKNVMKGKNRNQKSLGIRIHPLSSDEWKTVDTNEQVYVRQKHCRSVFIMKQVCDFNGFQTYLTESVFELFSPSNSAPRFFPSDSPPSPPPHPELIRNQQQTVRCIKERSGA